MSVPSLQVSNDLPQFLNLLGRELLAAQQGREELVGGAVVDLVDELVRLRFLHGGLGDQRMAEKARLAALNGAFADAALDERVGGVDVPAKLRGQDLFDR